MTGLRAKLLRPTVSCTLFVATTFAAPPAPGERDTPADTPRATQRVDTAPPPAVPDATPADPGASLPPLPPIESGRFISERTAEPADASPALSPSLFNPDPGASLHPLASAEDSYFQTNHVEFVRPEQAPVPAALALPRGPLEEVRIVPAPPAPSPSYGLAPLTGAEKLPRADTRENLHINTDWHAPESYASAATGKGIPPNTKPVSDRWRDAGFTPWRRYTSGDTNEMPYADTKPSLWDYYRQSLLKGDLPICGQDVFLALTASGELLYEDRKLTVPSGASASSPASSDFFGKSRSTVFVSNFAFDAVLFEGETVFKPVEWAVKIKPVFNYTRVDFRETGIVSPNPGGPGGGGASPGGPPVVNPGDVGGALGGATATGNLNGSATARPTTYVALQEAFVEIHLKNLSTNYDFIAVKAGNQTFNSDFRGFVFNDTNLGVRLFGNYDDNLYQYNVALFAMREKDTNSDLNTFDSRGQTVFIANLYRQDFFRKGYTTQLSFLANYDAGGTQYDTNGAIVRPAPIGTVAPHKVEAAYFGWNGDGHIGRWNVSHSAYLVVGHDDLNGLAGRPVDICAQMAALEVSYDRDWIRYKGSVFYASGDRNPTDGKATGFDSIVDNTNFEGGPFSYFVRQGFNLGGSAVGLKQRFSLLPDLRTSKSQGQSNFVNPGLIMFGLGTDIDVTPKVKMFLSANYILFATTEPLKTALLANEVSREFGTDLGIGIQWRPLLKDNIIVSLGYGVLLPGQGFRDIYRNTQPGAPGYTPAGQSSHVDDWLYSAVAAVTFTY